ncbi:CAP domain-containing protein [Loktanella agnita]|uniref:CAP domain-containing protein n=1 Tax=Loktanella agnita TaxID=287097 RepID=UPI00398A1FDA
MKKHLTILSLLILPACMGGGDGTSVDLTPSGPSASMNAEFNPLLNGVRMDAGESELFYDERVGQAAQIHANDMLVNNELSIFLAGTERDMGDTLNSLGYGWQDIGQMVAQGNYSLAGVLSEWEANGSPAGSGGGGSDELTFEDYVEFGIAKAGSGNDQRWVLLLTNPN